MKMKTDVGCGGVTEEVGCRGVSSRHGLKKVIQVLVGRGYTPYPPFYIPLVLDISAKDLQTCQHTKIDTHWPTIISIGGKLLETIEETSG